MEKIKEIFSSKINWTAIAIMIISLKDFFTNYDYSDVSTKGWITFALALLTFIFRTWYTNVAPRP